ncbi:MAG: hypothetical protein IPF68_14865 [Bacteroidales bacterium]|nr:hypothetical protein [Bacteroidales bacterium]
MTTVLSENQPVTSNHGRIRISHPEPGTTSFEIPKEGFSYKGSFTLLIIISWLLMIMVWTILLLQFNSSLALISIPFWLLGIVTLRLSLKVIMASQEVVVSSRELTILKKEGSAIAHVTFRIKDIEKIILVEGAYKALSGITRKGNYPAVISNQEAFGFGERCTKEEKQFLLDAVKNITGH